jgi:hypothetical protein
MKHSRTRQYSWTTQLHSTMHSWQHRARDEPSLVHTLDNHPGPVERSTTKLEQRFGLLR